jgi:murein DD-endopeptidase MepM/ murein hydrolase activator NlpD
VRSRRCFADLQAEDAIFFQQGLRFGLIEPDEPGVGAYSYPWKSGVTYKVNQGNDTAPPDSHNGVQKYAFDFDLPVGTEIRAAREGTVERVREDLPDSYNSATVNIPGRVLANWGNYLRIRHADGTTSWYFHLRNNGVTVNVNDVVQKGQPIAISSNTGRSTGAHLHFQVQPDSTNWGQTIPIAFQNCETPGKNTKVTSDNANASFP